MNFFNNSLIRLKDICSYTKGFAFKVTDFIDNGIPLVKATDIKQYKIQKPSFFIDPKRLKNFKSVMLYQDDIVISSVGSQPDVIDSAVGQLALVDKDTEGSLLNQNTVIIRFDKKQVNSKFILYNFNSIIFRSHLDFISRGTANQSSIKISELLVYQILIPNYYEQTAIATYLDRKTSAIDRKVALLERKIIHYQQLRKSLINETVCRGLDKNTKLKDSGIEWIGMIPEHWEVKRLKDVCGFINRGSSPNYDETGLYKVVNQATFSKGIWDESSLRFTQSFKIKPRGLLKEDDILIASTGGGVLGKIYFFSRNESDYIADSHITILRDTQKSYFSKYVYYYFSEKFKLINDILAQGSTNQTELQKDWLLAFFICIPPQAEQVACASYLDEKTQKIDSIVSNIKSQIETLKELRKTLINDVVTGKIKVV